MHEEETNWALISITLRYWFKKAWGVKKVYCRFKQRVLVQIVQVFPVRVAIGLRCKAKLAKFLLKISKIDQTNVTTDKKLIGLLQKTNVIGDHIEGMFT